MGDIFMVRGCPVRIDVVVPGCGCTHFLRRHVRSMLTRACASCRVVLLSSTSASSDISVLGRCGAGSHITRLRVGSIGAKDPFVR